MGLFTEHQVGDDYGVMPVSEYHWKARLCVVDRDRAIVIRGQVASEHDTWSMVPAGLGLADDANGLADGRCRRTL